MALGDSLDPPSNFCLAITANCRAPIAACIAARGIPATGPRPITGDKAPIIAAAVLAIVAAI